MMKKKTLLSMLLLLAGVSVQAQSVSTEQMDERFNDGTKLPYGWFTEGWTVKDAVSSVRRHHPVLINHIFKELFGCAA